MATYNDTAKDWELASIGGFAYAEGGGAGVYGFRLRSASLALNEPFFFGAMGVGAGGNATGFDLQQVEGLQWSALDIQTPMSVQLLHRCPGTLVSGSIGVGKAKSPLSKILNVGWSRLDAVRSGTVFFVSSGFGVSGGSGTGATALAGFWFSYALNGNSVNPVSPWWENMKDMAREIQELPGRLDREIRRLYGAP